MKDPDTGMDAVRRAREQISRLHGNVPRRLVDYYMKLQESHRDRLVESKGGPVAAVCPDKELETRDPHRG